jgi:hypothetical protein
MRFDARQRAVVKIHYFNHGGDGGAALKAHARYVARDAAGRDNDEAALPSPEAKGGREDEIARSVWNSSLRALTEAVAIWASREAFSSRSMLALNMRRLPLFFLSGAKSRDPFATCATGRGATCARRRDP